MCIRDRVHGPVLAAGVVGILRGHAITVFWFVAVCGQEEFETALALAGGMAPVHPVDVYKRQHQHRADVGGTSFAGGRVF